MGSRGEGSLGGGAQGLVHFSAGHWQRLPGKGPHLLGVGLQALPSPLVLPREPWREIPQGSVQGSQVRPHSSAAVLAAVSGSSCLGGACAPTHPEEAGQSPGQAPDTPRLTCRRGPGDTSPVPKGPLHSGSRERWPVSPQAGQEPGISACILLFLGHCAQLQLHIGGLLGTTCCQSSPPFIHTGPPQRGSCRAHCLQPGWFPRS